MNQIIYQDFKGGMLNERTNSKMARMELFIDEIVLQGPRYRMGRPDTGAGIKGEIMSKQEQFLKWLIEEEKVSPVDTIKSFGAITGVVMILGWYERWKNITSASSGQTADAVNVTLPK
jgi:hypothetical protein